MNETYAIEKQAVALGYASAKGTWTVATNYSCIPSNYPGKIYDNVGWVERLKQTASGKWGGYIWAMQNTVDFKTSPTNVWVSTNGVTNNISNVLVGSLGNYGPVSNVVDVGPSINTNFPKSIESIGVSPGNRK